MLLEYLITSNTLKTLNVLNNLNTFRILNASLTAIIDGSIESKSIIAIGVNGYKRKDIPIFLQYL